ncbi:MAG: 4-hydroxy-tetrahydrodipicolinate reductase [Flavobacteriales bacterium]|jgi:4-hydroxy-tetrahydrodipicolinate reductase|nr:4-hydroxy-tetrahydrodipicolinate reductase [Flavobacteriales bacterium]MBT6747035.1 4-hydroxy-tetrahydrodipicolinate reductase [Flavobacteriales bacterium]
MKIALLGYGKMGKAIEEIALKRGHSVVFKTNEASMERDVSKADLAIDFSTPETVVDNIKKCFAVNVPVVVGTTGWYERFSEVCRLCELGGHSLFHATNFSIGVNIFFEVNKKLAELMNSQPDYEIEMTEIHHTQKLDSPSGTAITLADGIIENVDRKSFWSENKPGEESILIHAKRERDVPGIHIVNYENEIDNIEIKHEAKGRIGFATGAVLAAEWLLDKPGVYTMKDLLKL